MKLKAGFMTGSSASWSWLGRATTCIRLYWRKGSWEHGKLTDRGDRDGIRRRCCPELRSEHRQHRMIGQYHFFILSNIFSLSLFDLVA